jgi:hypothetical protein
MYLKVGFTVPLPLLKEASSYGNDLDRITHKNLAQLFFLRHLVIGGHGETTCWVCQAGQSNNFLILNCSLRKLDK